VKPQKQPRLDVGGPAQAARLREAAPLLEALKAKPLVDKRTGELTPEGRNVEMQTAEARKALKLKTDPFAAALEKRRQRREADKARALILDARFNALRMRIPAVVSAFRAFGEISPDAQGLASQTLNSLNVDVEDVMKSSGLDGVEALLVEYETKTLPELKERCTELQNEFMRKLAAEREKITAEQTLESAKRLGPDKALKLLESSGLRLRVNEGELETAGPIDVLGMAILKLYRDALIERLQARENWRRVAV
jgi:hypothetical protein